MLYLCHLNLQQLNGWESEEEKTDEESKKESDKDNLNKG